MKTIGVLLLLVLAGCGKSKDPELPTAGAAGETVNTKLLADTATSDLEEMKRKLRDVKPDAKSCEDGFIFYCLAFKQKQIDALNRDMVRLQQEFDQLGADYRNNGLPMAGVNPDGNVTWIRTDAEGHPLAVLTAKKQCDTGPGMLTCMELATDFHTIEAEQQQKIQEAFVRDVGNIDILKSQGGSVLVTIVGEGGVPVTIVPRRPEGITDRDWRIINNQDPDGGK